MLLVDDARLEGRGDDELARSEPVELCIESFDLALWLPAERVDDGASGECERVAASADDDDASLCVCKPCATSSLGSDTA